MGKLRIMPRKPEMLLNARSLMLKWQNSPNQSILNLNELADVARCMKRDENFLVSPEKCMKTKGNNSDKLTYPEKYLKTKE